jgi:hypothetical protein
MGENTSRAALEGTAAWLLGRLRPVNEESKRTRYE